MLCGPYLGEQLWGGEEQENPGWGLSAWLQADVCKCMVGGRWGWVPCMPGCALASVSMCPCLSASLSNRCRLLFLADHLTPAALDSSLSVWGA